jgi:hypothetical protein
LSSRPQFRLLKRQGCYQRYISLLSPKWQKAVAFVYIKEETLFIAVNHPAFKMELNYNKDLLISLLRQLNKYVQGCEGMLASKVVIFHSKYHPMPEKKAKERTVPHYIEQARGNFSTPHQAKLKERFERIRRGIQAQCKA